MSVEGREGIAESNRILRLSCIVAFILRPVSVLPGFVLLCVFWSFLYLLAAVEASSSGRCSCPCSCAGPYSMGYVFSLPASSFLPSFSFLTPPILLQFCVLSWQWSQFFHSFHSIPPSMNYGDIKASMMPSDSLPPLMNSRTVKFNTPGRFIFVFPCPRVIHSVPLMAPSHAQLIPAGC